MKKGYERRIYKSFKNAPVVALYPYSRIVLFSDCHRGVGNSNDNFLKNQHIYLAALKYYYKNNFIYIELGDGDELWENRSFSAIKEIHEDVFNILSLFEKKNHLWLIYGNHDYVMKNSKKPIHYSGLILRLCGYLQRNSKYTYMTPKCFELYLTHGHQADFLNSTLWKLSRFLVRYLWKPLEQIGILDPTSAAKNYQRKEKSEKRLSDWAIKNNCYIITGHTHRPMMGSDKTRYFNVGSCVHPHSITCIEIENGMINLVKWFVDAKPDSSLFVSREVISAPFYLFK